MCGGSSEVEEDSESAASASGSTDALPAAAWAGLALGFARSASPSSVAAQPAGLQELAAVATAPDAPEPFAPEPFLDAPLDAPWDAPLHAGGT